MNINALDCLIDLHIHLDGSLPLDAVKKLAKMQKIDLPLDDQDLLNKLQVPENCQDLNEYLSKFEFPLQLMQTKDALEFSIISVLHEQRSQGIIYSEIRFAPQFHTMKGLTQNEVVNAVLSGLSKVNHEDIGIKSNLILCCMRGDDNHDANMETVRIASEYLNQGVVAIDLAGAEGLYPTEQFKDIIAYASSLKVPYTIHAGEADGPKSIANAINYGAHRIGHGIRCVEDPEVMKLIRNNHVTLELCPTSNLNTKIFRRIQDYPIQQLLDAGIRFTINTDNMTVSNTNIKRELNLIQNTFHLNDEIMSELLFHAAEAAFIKQDERILLSNRIKCNLDSIR